MDNSKKTLSLKKPTMPEAPPPALPDSIQALIAAAVAAALAAQGPDKTPAPALVSPEKSVEELRQMLELAETKRSFEESQKIVIEPRPWDKSHLPPVGERSSASVQAPARIWGNPQWAAGFKV